MVASLAACALLAASSDVMVGVVVSDSEGQLTTFAATVVGASRRITTRVGIGWIRTKDGWLWAANRKGRWGAGEPLKLIKELAPPAALARSRAKWLPAWFESGSFSWKLEGEGQGRPLFDLRREALGPELPLPPEKADRVLRERFGTLSPELREKWSPFAAAPGSGGYFYREGRLHWGVSLASTTAVGDDFVFLAEPIDDRPESLWSSAKAISDSALAAVGSDSSGWGFIVTPEEVKLAPLTGGRFGAPQRLQAWSSQSVVAWWQAEGDVQELDSEFRSLRLPEGW